MRQVIKSSLKAFGSMLTLNPQSLCGRQHWDLLQSGHKVPVNAAHPSRVICCSSAEIATRYIQPRTNTSCGMRAVSHHFTPSTFPLMARVCEETLAISVIALQTLLKHNEPSVFSYGHSHSSAQSLRSWLKACLLEGRKTKVYVARGAEYLARLPLNTVICFSLAEPGHQYFFVTDKDKQADGKHLTGTILPGKAHNLIHSSLEELSGWSWHHRPK